MPDMNVKFGRFEADFVWREQRLTLEHVVYEGPRVLVLLAQALSR